VTQLLLLCSIIQTGTRSGSEMTVISNRFKQTLQELVGVYFTVLKFEAEGMWLF